MPSENIVQMNYSNTAQAAEALETAPKEIRRLINELEMAMLPVARGMLGETKAAYDRITVMWNDSCNDMELILRRFGPTLTEAQVRTMTVDNNLFDSWNGIK